MQIPNLFKSFASSAYVTMIMINFEDSFLGSSKASYKKLRIKSSTFAKSLANLTFLKSFWRFFFTFQLNRFEFLNTILLMSGFWGSNPDNLPAYLHSIWIEHSNTWMKSPHCLKITKNVSFDFWHFPPIFVLLKLTCLVTLDDRKL